MVLLGGGDRVAALAVGAWIGLFGGGTFFGAIGFICDGQSPLRGPPARLSFCGGCPDGPP